MVLSGGMAKGAYQIGALKALSNYVPLQEIKYMSCASIGVLNGYAYATGGLDKAEEMWREICHDDSRMVVSRILRSSMLQQNIQNIYDPDGQLSCAFYCSLLNMNHKTVVYQNLASADKSHIPGYLKASVAMPIYNRAVSVDGVPYFDGAMIDNIPVFPLLKHNIDYIICIYFDDTYFKFENTYFDNKIIKVTFSADSSLRQSLVVSRENTEMMIKEGYEWASHLFHSVFSDGYENCESIYRTIDHMNKLCKTKKLRITGDVMVTGLNRVTQKFTKRKIVL